jgi:folate-binding protein YgfZ
MFSRDQYAAAHQSAVMFDRSSRGRIEMTGADRRTFLHALLTNDVAALAKGSGAYAAYLTPQGRMICDMSLLELGDRLLMGVEGAQAPALAERLDKLIFSEDVQVKDVSHDLDEIGVYGPAAAALIERASGVSVSGLVREYDNLTAGPHVVARSNELGVEGFVVMVPRSDRDASWSALAGAGVVAGVEATFETLRVEAGRPRFGIDMDSETIPLEAGIEDRAISFTKGCYIDDERVPSRGDTIQADGKEVGAITSAVMSPREGKPLALGYVHRDHSAPGTQLAVHQSRARVAAL